MKNIFESLTNRIKDTLANGYLANEAGVYHHIDEAEFFNSLKGDLKGIHCEACNDKGIIYFYEDEDETHYGELVCKKCDCMKKRQAFERLEKSGLRNLVDNCTFESYQRKEDFQLSIFNAAVNYTIKIKNGDRQFPFFYIGGQSGVGKTHICTAITADLIENGFEAVYMQWRADTMRLKSIANSPDYGTEIARYKNTAVLYIDDLFKNPKSVPTSADLNLAFEVINHRYINNLPTIISSELMLSEIIDLDEATGSRIKEKCHPLNIKRTSGRNFRLQ